MVYIVSSYVFIVTCYAIVLIVRVCKSATITMSYMCHTQYAISDVKLMLIANKRDIKEKRQVTIQQGKQVHIILDYI